MPSALFRPRRQTGVLLALELACAGIGLLPPQARAGEADEAFYSRAAQCTAVLKRDVLALKARHARGETAVRPEMQRLTEQSFTFIGLAYERGLRNPRADQMLDEAERALSGASAAALRQLSAECRAEGDKLFAEANALERALVRNRAKARLEKLLGPPARAG